MSSEKITLKEVDEVCITILMDNTVDLLMADRNIAQRFHVGKDRVTTIAEHGFSALVRVRCGDKQETVLLDTGISPGGVLHNMEVLNVETSEIQAIVLSHGHNDHTMGLPNLLERMSPKNVPVIVHPDAFLERKIVFPDGSEWNISGPRINDSKQNKFTFLKKNGPTLLAHDRILISGEIDRINDFEKGFPLHYTKRSGKWEQDPLIKDDQCLIVNVRNQGLVIITGCGHAGIVNSICYAQALTGIRDVCAVIGGFHLTGGIFEKIIPATVAELKRINPRYIMPGHCTGWAAIHKIANEMPEAFIPNNVGTKLYITGF